MFYLVLKFKKDPLSRGWDLILRLWLYQVESIINVGDWHVNVSKSGANKASEPEFLTNIVDYGDGIAKNSEERDEAIEGVFNSQSEVCWERQLVKFFDQGWDPKHILDGLSNKFDVAVHAALKTHVV